MKKEVIILRAVSNAGKTTFASLFERQEGWVVVSADDYFESEGGHYNFDPSLLPRAHGECQKSFVTFLNEPSIKGIVVCNTNCNPKDFRFYEKEAEKVGATVFHVVLERRHNKFNHHKVPFEVMERQEKTLRANLKLK